MDSIRFCRILICESVDPVQQFCPARPLFGGIEQNLFAARKCAGNLAELLLAFSFVEFVAFICDHHKRDIGRGKIIRHRKIRILRAVACVDDQKTERIRQHITRAMNEEIVDQCGPAIPFAEGSFGIAISK